MTTTSTYRAALLTGRGGLDKLVVSSVALTDPKPGEIRIKVLASGAGSTDLTMRTGFYIFAPPFPFTPGYEVVGIVDKIGPNTATALQVQDKVAALVTHGGMAEYCTRPANCFIKVNPPTLSDESVVAIMLNYMTAYQMIKRKSHIKPGQTALVTGANGGVGTALLELLQLQNIKTYAYLRSAHFDVARRFGAIPIEDKRSTTETLDAAVHRVVPEGVDVAFDVMGGLKSRECVQAVKRGGIIIGYGFSSTFVDNKASNYLALRGLFTIFVGAKLAGRRSTFYGVTADYRRNPMPYKEDLAELFQLLDEGKIKPLIAHRLPLTAARQSQELLEAGGVNGKIVLLREVGVE